MLKIQYTQPKGAIIVSKMLSYTDMIKNFDLQYNINIHKYDRYNSVVYNVPYMSCDDPNHSQI